MESRPTSGRETGLYPRLAALTNSWIDLFGYLAPSVVSSTIDEYHACRNAAALMDFSMLRTVDINGPGAVELVDTVVSRDLSKLTAPRIVYSAIVDERGKMIDDCTCMLRTPQSVRFCGASDRDFELFSERATAGINVTDRTDDLAHLCVQGPRSREILQSLTASDLSPQAFPYYTFREDIEIAGLPVFMTRLGYTAELGYELWVERSSCLQLWDALIDAGTPRGMRVLGMDALDLLRVEGGFIIGGVEYDETTSPYECGLGWTIDTSTPQLVGRESLIRDHDTVLLRLASVQLASGGDAASRAPIELDGVPVGSITQAITSPYLGGATLGLAKIRKDLTTPGTAVTARIDEQHISGTVVQHPVYDPDRHRARQS